LKAIKPEFARGFVLIEVMIVLLVITLLLPATHINNVYSDNGIENMIIYSQLKAIATRKPVFLDSQLCPLNDCWFNPRGNINKSRTIFLMRKERNYELVIWLGFGRFRVKERFSDD
jgi:prepilin-type N-terminal cleavage/methylation domain-containing protein